MPLQRSQKRRAKLGKRILLPMPRHEIEAMSLQYHVTLEALRMRQGSAHGLRTLLQMVVLTGFIDDARRREIRIELLVAAEREINAAFERGAQDDVWRLAARGDDLVAALLGWHDDQLRTGHRWWCYSRQSSAWNVCAKAKPRRDRRCGPRREHLMLLANTCLV